MADDPTRFTHVKNLIDGFQYEKSCWTQRVKDLAYQYNNLLGDILLSSGIIAYLGAFDHVFRQVCISM